RFGLCGGCSGLSFLGLCFCGVGCGLRVFGGEVEILRLLARRFGSFGLLGGFGSLFVGNGSLVGGSLARSIGFGLGRLRVLLRSVGVLSCGSRGSCRFICGLTGGSGSFYLGCGRGLGC